MFWVRFAAVHEGVVVVVVVEGHPLLTSIGNVPGLAALKAPNRLRGQVYSVIYAHMHEIDVIW